MKTLKKPFDLLVMYCFFWLCLFLNTTIMAQDKAKQAPVEQPAATTQKTTEVTQKAPISAQPNNKINKPDNSNSSQTEAVNADQIDYINAIASQNDALNSSTELLKELDATLPDLIKNANDSDATQTQLLKASTALEQTNSKTAQIDTRNNVLKARLGILSDSLDQLNAREQILSNPATTTVTPEQKAIELANIKVQRTGISAEQAKINENLSVLQAHKTILQKIQALQSAWLTKIQTLILSKLEVEKSIQPVNATNNNETTETKYTKTLALLRTKLDSPTLGDQERVVTLLSIDALKINQTIKDINGNQAPILDAIKILEQLLTQPNQSSAVINTAIESLKNNNNALKLINSGFADITTNLEKISQKVADFKVAQKEISEDKVVQKALKDLDDILVIAKNLFAQLQQDNADTITKINNLNDKVGQLARNLFNNELTNYAHWPNDRKEWQEVFKSLGNSPRLFLNQIKESIKVGVNSFKSASSGRQIAFISLEIFILLAGFLGFYLMKIVLIKLQKSGAISQYRATQSIFILISKNILSITIAILLILPLFFFKIPEPGKSILLVVNLSWLMLKLPLSICYFLMVDTPHIEQRDPRLFRLILLSTVTGGLIGICLYMANKLGLPPLEINTLHRVFFLWLLFMQWPLLRFHQYIRLASWNRVTQESNPNAFIISNIINILLRIGIILTGLIGLIGFINLAMLLIYYTAIFITISICWKILGGLLSDCIYFIKEWAMINTKMGILWAQDIINPIHKLLKVLLFLYMWLIFPILIGVKKDSALATWFITSINSPLITLGGAGLSIEHIVIAVFSIVSIFSFAKWLRAIAFRWILAKVIDTGVRHSLSVLVQYLIVITGFIIILNFLNINLTTLTVFAGALGVGIGFGLQTIANNLVSGILLLIERPLRSGDIVEIANHTGTIDRIGIRSITMRTFDNTDVIIPNSSVISGSFVNWTYQNHTLRSVLIIGVGYAAPPAHVIELFTEIINNQEGILKDKERSIYIDEFAPSSINYRIVYFVDINNSSKAAIKSEILLKIYNMLAQYQYDLPYPQQVIHIQKNSAYDQRPTPLADPVDSEDALQTLTSETSSEPDKNKPTTLSK